MNDETEITLFGDESEQPKQSTTSNVNRQQASSSVSQSNNNVGDGYTIVQRDEGEGKSNFGQVVIETAIKGLLYRCEVFSNGVLIDAKEIDCKDLLSNAGKDFVFKQRYLATHNTFKLQYIAEELFKEVASLEGDFQDGEEHCKVVTSISEDTIRTVVYLDGEEFETKQLAIPDNIKSKKNLIEKKYQVFHLENVERYINKEKFPVNTFLDPLLQKLPFYKKKPMYAFYLFLLLVVGMLFLLKFAYCNYLEGQDPKSLVKNRIGEQVCHVLENKCLNAKENGWQKGVGIKKGICLEACTKNVIGESGCSEIFGGSIPNPIPRNPYTITPQGELELSQQKITTVYLKNNTSKTLRFKVAGRKIIDNSNSEIIMFINDKTEVSLEPNEEDKFEIRLESTYIGSFNSGTHKGEILFAVYNDDKSIDTTEKRNFTFRI